MNFVVCTYTRISYEAVRGIYPAQVHRVEWDRQIDDINTRT